MGMIAPTLAQWLDDSGMSTSNGVFITGTDTGVGKTWVGTQLIRVMRVLGREVIPRKPVESGWVSDLKQTDAWQLADAAGLPLDNTICPYRFTAALAPPRAARQAGTTLGLQQLAATCPTRWETRQFLHVEGAGGFYSPIAHDGINADLAQILGLPIILVAEDRVGCMNHVLLIAEAIQHRALRLAGIILNARQTPIVGMDNRHDLQQYLDIPIMQFPCA